MKLVVASGVCDAGAVDETVYKSMAADGKLPQGLSVFYTSAPFAELAKLEPKEQAATAAFHEVLHELRWYVSYTEDMPSTVKLTVSQYVRRLDELHHALRVTLGPPEALGHRVIDA